MQLSREIAERAKSKFEVSLDAGSLGNAIALLFRADVEVPVIRGWASGVNRDYGLALNGDAFDRCMARGLQLAKPQPPDEPEDEIEPAAIDVRPPARAPDDFPAVPMFRDAETMLAVCLDAQGVRARLEQLKAGIAAIAAAQDQLAADRAQFDTHVAEAQAGLAAREKKVRARELKVFQDEAAHRKAQERVAELSAKIDRMHGRRIEVLSGGGLTREFCVPDRPDDDLISPAPVAGLRERNMPPAEPIRVRAGRGTRKIRARA